MRLLTAETLPEQTALDRYTPWADDDLDALTAGLLREQAPPSTPYPDEQPDDGRRWERPEAYWIEVRLILLRMMFTHEL